MCIAVHGLFVGNAYADLRAAGMADVVSCDSVAHESNRIALSGALADAIGTWPHRGMQAEGGA